MNELFDAIAARLQAIVTAHAALELEAELIDRHVRRKAALLRQAGELEAEGLGDLAAELRRHANQIVFRKPASLHAEAADQAPAADADHPTCNGNGSTGNGQVVATTQKGHGRKRR